MLNNKKIALYMDVDNCNLSYDNFLNAIIQLEGMGEILTAKIYGATERRHKDIIAEVVKRGFDLTPTMRVKRRGLPIIDNRMLIDAMEDVLQNTNIDLVAFFAPPTDMVYFYRKLRSYNISVVALDNNDEESSALVDQFLDLGIITVLKKTKSTKTAPNSTLEAQLQQDIDTINGEMVEDKALETVTDTIEPFAETATKTQVIFEQQDQQSIQMDSSQQSEVSPQSNDQTETEMDSIEDVIDIDQPAQIESMTEEESKITPIPTSISTEFTKPQHSFQLADATTSIDELEELEQEKTSIDQNDSDLLEEIKKLLDEFKTNNR